MNSILAMRYLDEVRQYLHDEPFRPFEIVLHSGQSVKVVDRGTIAYSPARTRLSVFDQEEDSPRVLPVSDTVSVLPLPEHAAYPNGKPTSTDTQLPKVPLAAIRKYYYAQPFVPIQLTLDDGSRIKIMRKLAMRFWPSGRGMGCFDYQDRSHTFEIARIVAVEPIDLVTTSSAS